MDIFDEIKSEHDQFRNWVEKIVETTDRAVKTREENFRKLYIKLTAHHNSEEEVLNPLLRENEETKEFAIEIDEEHQVIDNLMEELKDLPVTAENWLVKFEVMNHTLDHHLEDEEEEITEKARQVFDKERLENLVDDFEVEMDKEMEKLEKEYTKA